MKNLALVTSLLLVPAVARAEPDPTPSLPSPGYLAVGGQIDGALGTDAGFTIDLGYRLRPTSTWFVHGGVGFGAADDVSEAVGTMQFYYGNAHYTRARVGLEREACVTGGIVCGLAGFDASVMRTSSTTGPWMDTPPARYTEELLTPSVGVDIGSQHVRFRTTLGLNLGLAQRTAAGDNGNDAGLMGMELGTAVVYRF